MSRLAPLLEIQELDLACDRLTERRRTLPEREALARAHQQADDLDRAHAALVEAREAHCRSEDALGAEVAGVAAKAKELEENLYSGRVKILKELEALQEELRLLRERQTGLEEQEMALLEEIERTEGAMQANRAARGACDEQRAEIEQAIGRAEAEIDGELADLAARRGEMTGAIPAPVLDEYVRLRGKTKLAGRAAALLAEGSCGGCRVKLPVLDYNRMKAEPEDALIRCVRCGRVLVR